MIKPENITKDFPTDAITLTKTLVGIDSTNPGSYEKNIAAYICKWLEHHRISYKTEEVLDGRYNIMAYLYAAQNSSTDRGPNICHIHSSDTVKEPSELVYICHMDTVVVGDGWSTDAFAPLEKDGKIYGRGSCDMKSGLACALSALYMLSQNRKKIRFDFKLICTVDEEDYMRGVEKVIDSGWVNKYSLVLDTEPTDAQIQVAHKGRVWIKADIIGRTAHASRPYMGIDAVAGISEFIVKLRKRIMQCPAHPELGSSTITFGQIQGGYRPYVVADIASVWIDIRTVPPLTSDLIKLYLDETAAKVRDEFDGIVINYKFTGDRPFIERDENSFLLKKLKEVCESTLSAPQEVSFFTGYTDTAVIAGRLHNKNCMSYGPGSLDMAHKPNEFVPVNDILRCEKVLQNLANRLCIN